MMRTARNIKRQQGAALIVGLILLVVITVLAISGMNTATTELAMARNDQNYENAFQAAETGLETALSQGQFLAQPAPVMLPRINLPSGHEYVDPQVQFEDPPTPVPPEAGAFSLGVGGGMKAYHFVATATAISARDPGSTTDRDASAVHTQAFFIVGPEDPSIGP